MTSVLIQCSKHPGVQFYNCDGPHAVCESCRIESLAQSGAVDCSGASSDTRATEQGTERSECLDSQEAERSELSPKNTRLACEPSQKEMPNDEG